MAIDDSIASWTTTDLLRFIQAYMRGDDTVQALSLGTDNFNVTNRLTIANELQFLTAGVTTPGAAGSASALPATPELYVKVLGPDGAVRLLPLYRTS